MRFSNKVVIVTGGTRGIGAAISQAFLAEGANVIATYSGNVEAAKTFYQENAQEDRLQIERFSVANGEEVEAFFKRFEERHDSLHVLVNNAGIRRDNIVGMLSEDEWDQVLDVNLKGTFLMSKQAVRQMSRARFGRIINITSPSGDLGFAGQGNYAASKAGQQGFMRALAKEVAKRQVTVNCVAPGFIQTELLSDLSEDQLQEFKAMVPAGRFGSPQEVADAVLFLASDQAAYITGTTVRVSGGL